MGKVNRIGFPCLTTGLGLTTGHTLKLATFSEEKVFSKINENISDFVKILNWMGKNNLRLFRLSCEFIPFASHKLMMNVDWESHVSNKLNQIGSYFVKYDFRFSIHAMPFVVLNSQKPWVVKNSINELIYYNKLLDLMKLDSTHKIIIHPGGVYNDKQQATKDLIKTLNESIPDNVKSRLVLENDDKHYSFSDVLNIGKICGIPPIFDIHHFYLLPSKKIIKDLDESTKLWGCVPKIHASSSMPNARHGTHDDFTKKLMLKRIVKLIPFDCDIMFECGKKEEAAKQAYQYFEENNYLV